MEDFTSQQSLATDSFSYSWLTNPSPSFDRLIDESTINEFMISLPLDKEFDFNVVLPESESESKSSSESTLIHADEIFSGGCILPVYNNSISVPATPVVVCSFTGEKQRKKRQRFSLRYFRESSNRILKNSFLIFSKLGCSREGVRVDDLSRKVKEIRSRNTSNRTSPEYRRGEIGAGAGAGAGGKLKSYGSGDFSRKMKKNNGYKDLRSVKSCNNTPWSSPSSQSMNPWQHHVEISIDDAILHCKRSFDMSYNSVNDEMNLDIEELEAGIDDEAEEQTLPTDENEGNEEEENLFCKKKRKRTSAVWDEMSEVSHGGVTKVQCNHCKQMLAKSPSGATTQYRRHLDTCIPRKSTLAERSKQPCLSFTETNADGNTSIINFSYDHSKVRELAAHMTLAHEYPFLQMEHAIFNKFLKAISPFYVPINRHMVKRDCFTVFENERKKLKNALKGISRISVTTDLWKSGQHIQYMVVTGHYIDSDWGLKKCVLNFCNVPPPHTGVIIADALSKCFVEWGIEDKIFSITVDNASYNDVCVKRLKEDLSLRKTLSIGGKLFHVRCCAHILNILVQDGLKQIEDVIDTVREGIKYLKNSESRLIQFAKIKNQLHLSCKSLTLDCQTRWNGTYMMLAASLEVKDVFPRYADIDPGFHYVPTPHEWKKVEEVCKFLGTFNVVTNIISGTEYPTSNLFLVELYEIKALLNEKALDESESIRKMAFAMEAKFDKYWGDSNVLLSLGAILDPRYKMNVIKFSFDAMYGKDLAPFYVDEILKTLHALFNEYVVAYSSSEGEKERCQNKRGKDSSGSGSIEISGQKVLTGKAKFHMLMSQVDKIPSQRSDLDIYLEENSYNCDADEHLDVLEWWKGERFRFRILSKMASDILSIPITSVASEATFSAGGRVVDEHRASLSVDTVEMLLCARDWVRSLHGLKRKARNQEEESLVQAFEKIALPDV